MQVAVAGIYQALASQCVLLIFDNVITESALLPFLPPVGCRANVHILVTTPSVDWKLRGISTSIPHVWQGISRKRNFMVTRSMTLPPFDNQESYQYLRKKLVSSQEKKDVNDDDMMPDVTALEAVLKVASGIPLALSQVAAYVRAGYCSLKDYPQRFAQQQLRGGVDGSASPVLVTTLLSLFQLYTRQPLVVPLLIGCSYVGSEAIPVSLLRKLPGLKKATDQVLLQAIQCLREHAFLFPSTEKTLPKTLTLPASVQSSVRAWHGQVPERRLKILAAWHALLLPALAFDEKHMEACYAVTPLVPHGLQLAYWEEIAGMQLVDCADLYFRIGRQQCKIERYALALQTYKNTLRLLVRHYGENHLALVPTLDNMGLSCYNKGDLKQAKIYYERAIRLEEEYGDKKDHLGRLTLLLGLGAVCGEQGELERAKALHERALRLQETEYGKDDVRLAKTLINLGVVCYNRGELKAARIHYDRAVHLQETEYGKDDVRLADPLHNLGVVYDEMGNLDQAKTCYKRALHLLTCHYGKEDVQLARTLLDLGVLYDKLEDPQQAKGYYTRALRLQEGHYGENHVELVKTLINLAATLCAEENLDQAKTYYERALRLQESYYGRDHLRLASTLSTLGMVCDDLEQFRLAKDYYERALRLYEKLPKRFFQEIAQLESLLQQSFGGLSLDSKSPKQMPDKSLSPDLIASQPAP